MAGAHYKLDNLVALVDVNEMQADGKVADIMTVEPVADKWKAFGWYAQSINGNSIEELVLALGLARSAKGSPKVIVCYTLMGKGVPFLEQRQKARTARQTVLLTQRELSRLTCRRDASAAIFSQSPETR